MILTKRYFEAFRYAAELHTHQVRKGSDVPYLSHLMSVSALVMEYGGTENEAIAGLLHDAAEDQGGYDTLDEIREHFGDEVAEIVEACSDTFDDPKPPWRLRKEAYLAHLKTAPNNVLMVSLADKLHNSRSILTDVQNNGVAVFDKFRGKREGTLWYYRSLVTVFKQVSTNAMVREFEHVVGCIEKMLEESLE